ncbi:putative Trypanosome variant surface glycoprotein (A type) [Trypanosoma vivax]|nr:putative Trypanosome variant surface glycoprotein (A type) [Trypanosoma vivax]
MLATNVRLLTAVFVTLLACTSIEATTPEGLPSGAAKMLCDFGRELMDAAKIAAEAAKAARTKARLARENAAVVAAGKAAVDAIKAEAGTEKGASQEQREGRNAEAHLDAEDERAIDELDEAAEGAAKASSEATVSAQALKQYITMLGALAGKTTSAKTCLAATGDMTVSAGRDGYMKARCVEQFVTDKGVTVEQRWSDISANGVVQTQDICVSMVATNNKPPHGERRISSDSVHSFRQSVVFAGKRRGRSARCGIMRIAREALSLGVGVRLGGHERRDLSQTRVERGEKE